MFNSVILSDRIKDSFGIYAHLSPAVTEQSYFQKTVTFYIFNHDFCCTENLVQHEIDALNTCVKEYFLLKEIEQSFWYYIYVVTHSSQ